MRVLLSPGTADLTARDHTQGTHSLLRRLSRPLVVAFGTLRRSAAERRLRDKLADMDDALLRDIGIADDEIYRIRARERFTPRAWSERLDGGRRGTV